MSKLVLSARSLGRRLYCTVIPPNTDRKKISGTAIAFFSIPLTTFGLGCWQIQRREQKLKLIADLKRRTTAAPVPLPTNLRELESMEYMPVEVRGTFDHSKELLIIPRIRNAEADTGSNLKKEFISSVVIGAHVITPFKLADRDMTILVNRGWVSKSRQNPSDRAEGQIQGETTLRGLVRLTEPKPTFVGENHPEANVWTHRDVFAMAHRLGTAPVYLEADYNSSVPHGPIGGQTQVVVRNEHLSYMATWFGLSIATSIMWYLRFVKPPL